MTKPKNQNNCATCDHKQHQDGGWCYMFHAEPMGMCGHHTTRIVVSFAQQRHKKITLAAFDALEHSDKLETLEQRAAVERAARNRL